MSKNFKYLDNLIHSGIKEIVLDSDIILGDDEKSKYQNGIKIDVDNVIINGNDHIIDAKKSVRIFFVTGTNVTLKKLTLKNGHAKEGGAIFNEKGGLTIFECKLNENISWDIGGAILNTGKLKISESSVNKNISDWGGAIWNDDNSKVSIYNSVFNKNRTMGYGGSIFNWGELIILESVLNENIIDEKGNSIDRGGGAICNGGSLLLSKSSLNKNNAGYGGAILNWKVLSIIESTINGNITTDRGGAIYNTDKVSISESIINKNTSKHGGAIFNNNGELSISKSTIIENIVNNGGGAIFNHKNGRLFIFESVINKNIASYGGAIYNNNYLSIYKSTLNENIAKWKGGAINNKSGFCTMDESELNKNAANNNGGAIFNEAVISISNSTLNENKSKIDGGAIYNMHRYPSDVSISKSTFNHNVANNGGAIYSINNGLNLKDCSFKDNKPDDVNE